MCAKTIKLSEAPINSKVKVVKILSVGLSKQRILDLGIIKGTIIKIVRRSPWGDPTAYLVRDTCIALRKEEADYIIGVILWD